MKPQLRLMAWLFSVVALVIGTASPAWAGLYWEHGVRASTISVCFVGNALTARAERVQQVLDYIKHYEYVANIHFDYLGQCAASIKQHNGNDYFDGDIRVVLYNTNVSGTGLVPGKGCPMFRDNQGNYDHNNDGWGSWSNAPDDLGPNRACEYNLKLGDDPWNGSPYLNHTLHEFGHALGLAHEHERNDVDYAHCNAPGYGGSASNGHITFYDRYSVMHYQFLSCGIDGNYSNAGLSDKDQLSVHILYPEVNRVAEFEGSTVIPAGSTLSLSSAWGVRGADLSFAATNFVWKLNNVTVSTTPDLAVVLSVPGDYSLQYAYTDFLGRNYSYTGVVHVLGKTTYPAAVASTEAALSPMLLTLSTVSVPMVLGP